MKVLKLSGLALVSVFLITLFSLNSYGQSSKSKLEVETVKSNHQFLGKVRFDYTAVTGYSLVPINEGADTAKVFYTTYIKRGQKSANRALTFAFNGGPGSSSVWLHMGALGPKRVKLQEDGSPTPPPYQVINNEYSWLPETDLVFIDPVLTGFSKGGSSSDKKDFLGYENDLKVMGAFIQKYLSEYKRWDSPKYLAGESYGTTRASGLSLHLQERYGINVNGLMLISSVLNFQTIRTPIGNDTPFPLLLPTYATTAWYHGKIGKEDYESAEACAAAARTFAETDYLWALNQGARLKEDPAKYQEIVSKLSYFTGLSETYIKQCQLRPTVGMLNKELIRETEKTVGRLDSRFLGTEFNHAEGSYNHDPSYDRVIMGPFSQSIYQHLTQNLKWTETIPYEILNGKVFQFWTYPQNRFLNTSIDLRKAMANNPSMKVWISNGYYDMATPFFATEYTLDHMFLPEELRGNIHMTYYNAGHMMYIDQACLKEFHADFQQMMRK